MTAIMWAVEALGQYGWRGSDIRRLAEYARKGKEPPIPLGTYTRAGCSSVIKLDKENSGETIYFRVFPDLASSRRGNAFGVLVTGVGFAHNLALKLDDAGVGLLQSHGWQLESVTDAHLDFVHPDFPSLIRWVYIEDKVEVYPDRDTVDLDMPEFTEKSLIEAYVLIRQR